VAAELIKLPDSVPGSVTDLDGNPIADATVKIKLVDFGIDQARVSQRIETTIERWTVKTNSKGEYVVDLSGVAEVPSHYCIGAEQVWADGFAVGRGRYWPTAEDVVGGEPIKAARLTAGRKVSGVVTTAAGSTTAAKIIGAGSNADPNNSWWMQGMQVSADGAFELFVPIDASVELLVYAKDHAPFRIAIKDGQSDLGRIVMQTGTPVAGVVRNRQGNPVPGVVVSMDTYEGDKLDGVAFGVHFAVLTDERGRFTMPAARGRFRIFVTKSAAQSDGIGRKTIIGIDPPLLVPTVISLSGDQEVVSVTLQETESQLVTGTVRWESGEPVADFEVTAGIMLESIGIHLSDALTDQKGHYRLELPKPLTNVYLNGFGKRNEKGVWHMAHGQADKPARPSAQYIMLDKLEGGFEGADWELRIFRRPKPVSASKQRADNEFAKLKTMEKQASATYLEKDALANDDPKEQQRIYQEFDPRNVMASKYLAFERTHRGDKVAFRAISEIMQDANSVGDPKTKVAKARNEMVDRLIEHYLGHEDLATVFRSMHAGPEVPRLDTLFRLASERSPHPHVRAAALLARAKSAKQKLRHVQMMSAFENLIREHISQAPASIRSEMEQRIAKLKAIDVEALRANANSWLNELAKDYAGVVHPNRKVPYRQCSQEMLFAINQVVFGKPAPELTASDVGGQAVLLSEYRGRVVVLTFCQDIFDSVERLSNQDLAGKFEGKSVELISILATSHLDKLQSSLQGKEIAGTLIWERLNGSLQAKWGVEHYPTTFLIGKDGTLHSGEMIFSDGLEDRIGRLLEE
jgi:peroxiredoxin